MARYTLSLHLAQPLSCSSSMRSRQAEHTTPCDPAPLRALSHRPLDADLFSQQTYPPRSRAGPDSRPGCLGRMALPRFLKRAAPLRALGRDASAQCGMRRGGVNLLSPPASLTALPRHFRPTWARCVHSGKSAGSDSAITPGPQHGGKTTRAYIRSPPGVAFSAQTRILAAPQRAPPRGSCQPSVQNRRVKKQSDEGTGQRPVC